MEIFTSLRFMSITGRIIIFIYINMFMNISLLRHVSGFNIYEEQVDVFRGESGSLFGYTVLQHENSLGKWILVGAPKSSSVRQTTLESPGALFKCQINARTSTHSASNRRCEQVTLDTKGNEEGTVDGEKVRELKNEQWLGVSLDSYRGGTGTNGIIVVCGHRWVNNYDGYYFNRYEYPHGLCYTVDSEFRQNSVKKLRPCLKGPEISSRGTPWFGWCQAGTSAHYTSDGTLLLGAPGTIRWRGTVISMANAEPQIAGWSVWFPSGEAEEGYVGYSITSGSFTSPTAKEGVTGAPRAYEVGKVFIFDVSNFAVRKEIYGEHMNTYFGSSLAAVDLNNDGLSDLLVGAPLYTDKMDEGRVYVYINQGEGNLQLMEPKLQGNNAFGGRFGTTIAVVGDLNQDGYQDVAIGAPFEDDDSGAVYIYHGSPLGLKAQYAQRLAGKSVDIGLASFGSSVNGGMDMDGNGYPDIVVGAHQNATVVYYRSQPVLTMEQRLHLTPAILSPRGNTTVCDLGSKKVPCIRIELCLRYTGHRVPAERGFIYTLGSDIQRTNHGLSSRFVFTDNQNVEGAVSHQVENTISLNIQQESCVEHTAYLKADVRDLLNSIPFQCTSNLHTGSRVDESSGLPLVLNQDFPNTITREAAFVRDCGDNGICETDMQVASFLETSSGINVLYLGEQSKIKVDILVTNGREEAHQARLTVTYPPDVIYIGFEPILGSVFPCDPLVDSYGLQCRLGNPMVSYSKVRFKLSFDVTSMLSIRDSLNFTVAVQTSSVEANETLFDNEVELSIPVVVLTDVIVRGGSLPEQVVYKVDKEDTGPSWMQHYLEDLKHVVQAIERHKSIGAPSIYNEGVGGPGNGTDEMGRIIPLSNNNSVLDEGVKEGEKALNESTIGPSVVFMYEVRNLGPSYIPYSSSVNISIPWRMRNGDWLIYLTELRSVKGIEACNMRDVLLEQSVKLKTHHGWDDEEPSSSTDGSNTGGDYSELPYDSGAYKLDCNSASCVTVTCHIQPLRVSDSVVIEIHALLWKYSFIQHSLGVSDLKSHASVKVDDSSKRFMQPDNHKPDQIQLITTVTAENITQMIQPIAPWIFVVSTIAGIALFAIIVFILSKYGFFHRANKEEMKKLLAENQSQQELSGDTQTKTPESDDVEL